jgi:hypothetical protein
MIRKTKTRKQYLKFMSRADCPFCAWKSTRTAFDGRIRDFRKHLVIEHPDKKDDEVDYFIAQEKV